MSPSPEPPFRRPWRAAAAVAVGGLIIPLAILWMTTEIRRAVGPRDDAVILWWPETSGWGAGAVLLGFLVGAGLASEVLSRPHDLWRLTRWPALAVVLIGLAGAAMSFGTDVRVYADRVVVSGEGVGHSLPVGSLGLNTARQVTARCHVDVRRRRSDIATLAYWIQFPDGHELDLAKARGPGHEGARTWFRRIARLDALLRHVPRTAAAQDISCVRMLRNELGEADFRTARRVLGISDADFARLYAEPHELWNR